MLEIKWHLAIKNSYSIYIQIFFFRITSLHLQSTNIFLFPSVGQFLGTLRCVLEHKHSMCNSRTLQHPKELGYFFILKPKQVTLQTPEGERNHRVKCRIQRKCVSLWAHCTLDCHHFSQNNKWWN